MEYQLYIWLKSTRAFHIILRGSPRHIFPILGQSNLDIKAFLLYTIYEHDLEKRKHFRWERERRKPDKRARDKQTTRSTPSADPKATSQWRRSLHSSGSLTKRHVLFTPWRCPAALTFTHKRRLVNAAHNVRERPS